MPVSPSLSPAPMPSSPSVRRCVFRVFGHDRSFRPSAAVHLARPTAASPGPCLGRSLAILAAPAIVRLFRPLLLLCGVRLSPYASFSLLPSPFSFPLFSPVHLSLSVLVPSSVSGCLLHIVCSVVHVWCVSVSYSVYVGPSVLTNYGSCSESGFFLRCFVWNHLSCTLSTSCRPPLHTLRLSTAVSWWASLTGRACTGSLCVAVFPAVHLAPRIRTRTLSLTAFGNTYMDTNRNLTQTPFPFMNSFIALSFPALTQICRYGLHHRVAFLDSVSKRGSP